MPILMMVLFLICSSQFAFAHGEDKPGPNGGAIKMPGAYHTELVLSSANEFKVFLLDMEFKNPTVKNSKILATGEVGKKKIAFACKAEADFFMCSPRTKIDIKPSKITLESARNGQKGMNVVYDFNAKAGSTGANHHGGH